jgi:hypothetical protein
MQSTSPFCCLLSVYLPADATNGEDLLRLFAMVGTTTAVAGVATVANYTWNIRIRQIDCSLNNNEDLKGIRHTVSTPQNASKLGELTT